MLLLLFIVLLFFVGVFAFFYKKEKTSHRWRKQSASKTLQKVRNFANDGQVISYLRKLDPFVFEELLLLAISENLNCTVIHNDKYTGDGGVDGKFILHQGNSKKLYLIQAKRYSSHINHHDVLKLSREVENQKAFRGLFIHTGKSGKQSFANTYKYQNVEIISGEKLVELVRFGF